MLWSKEYNIWNIEEWKHKAAGNENTQVLKYKYLKIEAVTE